MRHLLFQRRQTQLLMLYTDWGVGVDMANFHDASSETSGNIIKISFRITNESDVIC